ncbi:MAG: hypothetical protein RL173_105 [Fibrobacterota bacterium]|jgi:restriction system protein
MARKRKQDPVEGLVKVALVMAIGAFVIGKFAPGALGGFLKAVALPMIGLVVFAGILVFLRRSGNTPSATQDLPKSPLRRLKSTNSEISPSPALSAAIDEAMKVEKPRTRPSGFTDDVFRRMDWLVFEHFVVGLFGELGFKAKKTGAGADGGVDIELRGLTDADHVSPKALVQCKARSNSMVGVDKVRELYGVVSAQKVSRGILISNTGYTEDARAFTKQAQGLMLGDLDWIQKQLERLPPPTRAGLELKFLLPDYDVPSCPKCEIKLVPRSGKSGKFWGCSNYPRGCQSMLNWRSIDG